MECILHYLGGEPTLLKERLWFYEDFVLSCYYKADFVFTAIVHQANFIIDLKSKNYKKSSLEHSQEYQSEPKTKKPKQFRLR